VNSIPDQFVANIKDRRDLHVYLQFTTRDSELLLAISKTWQPNYKGAEDIFECQGRNMYLPRFAIHYAEIFISKAILNDFMVHSREAQECVRKAYLVCEKMIHISEPHLIAQALSDKPSFDTFSPVMTQPGMNLGDDSELLNDPDILFWKFWQLDCKSCVIVNWVL
jgi:hypothetical protein